ncbi:unnamed protein product [Lupinus luteus]|uniref:Uncharacterized protein n=1 Tax=Lupinus luteus TaxID=3873 RepID=A0AAV1W213_LUPLU
MVCRGTLPSPIHSMRAIYFSLIRPAILKPIDLIQFIIYMRFPKLIEGYVTNTYQGHWLGRQALSAWSPTLGGGYFYLWISPLVVDFTFVYFYLWISPLIWIREGSVPLQTIRAKIDYCSYLVRTIYGILGITSPITPNSISIPKEPQKDSVRDSNFLTRRLGMSGKNYKNIFWCRGDCTDKDSKKNRSNSIHNLYGISKINRGERRTIHSNRRVQKEFKYKLQDVSRKNKLHASSGSEREVFLYKPFEVKLIIVPIQ